MPNPGDMTLDILAHLNNVLEGEAYPTRAHLRQSYAYGDTTTKMLDAQLAKMQNDGLIELMSRSGVPDEDQFAILPRGQTFMENGLDALDSKYRNSPKGTRGMGV